MKAPAFLTRLAPPALRLLGLLRVALLFVWRLTPWGRPRPLPIRNAYVNPRSWLRRLTTFGVPIGLAFFGLVYGFYFALTAPYLLVAFASPVALLAVLCIWALPERATAPTRTMEFFFAAVIITLILWPNYLAVALPGLPWITMIRLTGFPMALLLAVTLSISAPIRKEVAETVRSTPIVWTIFLVFCVLQFVSVGLSKNPGAAMQKAIIHQVNWTAVLIIAAWLCRHPGRTRFYLNLLLALGLPIVFLAVLEYGKRSVLWAGSVPSFLKIDDPIILSMLGSITRSANGLYRAKATFGTPLGLAEFMALLTPFAIHKIVAGPGMWSRIFGFIYLPIIFYTVRMTDSRLGVNSFILSLLFYVPLWGLIRFRRIKGDMLAGLVVYAYPALLAVGYAAVSTIPPLRQAIFGGGAQAASNAARQMQLVMGIPKILANPVGFGADGAGAAMGYGAGEFVAIDNYYLVLGLNYGVMGIAAFTAMFVIAIAYGVREIAKARLPDDHEVMLLMPIVTLFGIFLVEKWVFAQEDNHPILFMALGMLMALVWRAKKLRAPAEALAAAAAEPARMSGPLPVPAHASRPAQVV